MAWALGESGEGGESRQGWPSRKLRGALEIPEALPMETSRSNPMHPATSLEVTKQSVLFRHIWLDPETVCYLDYDSDRACSAGPDPTCT